MCSDCLEAAYTGPGAGVGSGLLWMVEMVGRGSTVGTHSPATLLHHIIFSQFYCIFCLSWSLDRIVLLSCE